jgi:putative transposase
VPRQARSEVAGGYYHLTARGNGGDRLFFDDEDFDRFVNFLSRAVPNFDWRCLAYCAMPNHFHLVVQLTRESLSDGMRWLCGISARTFNRRHSRSGSVFGDRYRTTFIESERHLAYACRYVECNPVRASLCAHPRDWPWSSYCAAVGLIPAPAFLSRDAVQFVGGPRAYEGFVDELVAAIQSGSDPEGLTLGA